MKNRLEHKSNLIFWICKWSNGRYTEETLKSISVDKLEKIYNTVYNQRMMEINTIKR